MSRQPYPVEGNSAGAAAKPGAGERQPYGALVLHADDDVATAVKDAQAGDTVRVLWPDGQLRPVTLRHAVPFGHKFAVRAIADAASIRKYGERIGKARQEIQVGEHVHVHNVESERGRGDLTDSETEAR